MRIEEITADAIKAADETEIRNLRFRSIQLYSRYFLDARTEQVGGLKRREFLGKYVVLRNEMRRRAMAIGTETDLDKEVEGRIYKRAMWGLDVPSLGDLTLVENYVSIGGSFVKNPKEAADLDVVIRAPQDVRDEGMELKLGRLLRDETSKEPHFVYAERGPHSSYVPVFDLVLRARPETQKVEVREGRKVQKKLTATEQADCDAESEKIKENKKTWEGKLHKFKPAKWTHPNGHPRCLLCGDEEPIGGVCNSKAKPKEEEVMDLGKTSEQIAADLKKTEIAIVKPDDKALATVKQAEAPAEVGKTGKEADEAAIEKEALKKAEGKLTFKQGDSGTGIAQIHIMGLDEKQIETLKEARSRLLVARGDPTKLEATLKGTVGNTGAHIDMRLRRGQENYWEGNEIFIGNIEGLGKLSKLGEQNEKLRAAWKVGHDDEPETETIRGPLGWMEAGARGPEIFEPGTPGATANKYGAMLLIDRYKWSLYYAKASGHAYKFRFEGGRIFDGNFLFAFIPIDGGRIWMISRLPDDDHTKEQPEEKARFFKFLKINKRQQVVGGIVYEPDIADTQGDYADAGEIQKAMYNFMEKYARQTSRIKVMHKGKAHSFPVLECFQPEHDMKKGGETVKAGSWWLMAKITDKDVWQDIEDGKLQGFSMGGTASSA